MSCAISRWPMHEAPSTRQSTEPRKAGCASELITGNFTAEPCRCPVQQAGIIMRDVIQAGSIESRLNDPRATQSTSKQSPTTGSLQDGGRVRSLTC